MNSLEITIQIIGGLLGLAGFIWLLIDLFKSYLQIQLDVDLTESNKILAKVKIENRSKISKGIDNALLLVGPEDEKPVTTFNTLLDKTDLKNQSERIDCPKNKDKVKMAITTDDIAKSKACSSFYDGDGRVIIPLRFFYKENVGIGDEGPCYTAPIDKVKARFVPEEAYSVRLFIANKMWRRWFRLHRTTHDLFVLPKTTSCSTP